MLGYSGLDMFDHNRMLSGKVWSLIQTSNTKTIRREQWRKHELWNVLCWTCEIFPWTSKNCTWFEIFQQIYICFLTNSEFLQAQTELVAIILSLRNKCHNSCVRLNLIFSFETIQNILLPVLILSIRISLWKFVSNCLNYVTEHAYLMFTYEQIKRPRFWFCNRPKILLGFFSQ